MEAYEKEGLVKCCNAWSRDQKEKVYVQHKIMEEAAPTQANRTDPIQFEITHRFVTLRLTFGSTLAGKAPMDTSSCVGRSSPRRTCVFGLVGGAPHCHSPSALLNSAPDI